MRCFITTVVANKPSMLPDVLVASIIVAIAAVLVIVVHPGLWVLVIAAALWIFVRRGSRTHSAV
jgi:hypothetical protein